MSITVLKTKFTENIVSARDPARLVQMHSARRKYDLYKCIDKFGYAENNH
jgi:hypothetical protein